MPANEYRKYKTTLLRTAKPTGTTQVAVKHSTTTLTPQEKQTANTLKPKGLPLGLKYAIFTAVTITIASIILVIVAYASVKKEVENEIDEAGIKMTKVLASLDISFWESMRSNNQLARMSSEVADKMGIKEPSIINLVITKRNPNGEEYGIAGIRLKEGISKKGSKLLRETDDKIEISELFYSEEGSFKQIRTRTYTKPILDTKGNDTNFYINLFLSAQRIDNVLNNIFIAFIFPAILAIGIGAGIGFWMANQVTKPLTNLMDDMVEISRGNLEHQAVATSTDEIEVLTKVFNQMTQSLKIAHQNELDRKAMEHELHIAQEIQANLLPKKIPELPGYDIATYYRSSKEVGGDYYDIIQLSEKEIGIIVADVSGKGIPGSMVMTMVRSLLRMEATRNVSASDTLVKINRLLSADIRRGMFVTAIYLVLNTHTNSLLVSSAGHNPLIIWRKNTMKCELQNPNGIALGFDRGPVFERTIKEIPLQLYPGDRFVVYTDGIVESMNAKKEEFGNGNFIKLINQLGENDSKTFVNQVIKMIDRHQGEAPQHDDITLISVRFTG
jgi:serine phosphatase RsbU (regulator of sigma subunit)